MTVLLKGQFRYEERKTRTNYFGRFGLWTLVEEEIRRGVDKLRFRVVRVWNL